MTTEQGQECHKNELNVRLNVNMNYILIFKMPMLNNYI